MYFPRLYQHTTYMPNNDYTENTDYRFGYIILDDNVHIIFPIALYLYIQL